MILNDNASGGSISMRYSPLIAVLGLQAMVGCSPSDSEIYAATCSTEYLDLSKRRAGESLSAFEERMWREAEEAHIEMSRLQDAGQDAALRGRLRDRDAELIKAEVWHGRYQDAYKLADALCSCRGGECWDLQKPFHERTMNSLQETLDTLKAEERYRERR